MSAWPNPVSQLLQRRRRRQCRCQRDRLPSAWSIPVSQLLQRHRRSQRQCQRDEIPSCSFYSAVVVDIMNISVIDYCLAASSAPLMSVENRQLRLLRMIDSLSSSSTVSMSVCWILISHFFFITIIIIATICYLQVLLWNMQCNSYVFHLTNVCRCRCLFTSFFCSIATFLEDFQSCAFSVLNFLCNPGCCLRLLDGWHWSIVHIGRYVIGCRACVNHEMQLDTWEKASLVFCEPWRLPRVFDRLLRLVIVVGWGGVNWYDVIMTVEGL